MDTPIYDTIQKEDHVLFLKTKFTGYDATLILTASKLFLESENSGIFKRGIISFLPFLRRRLQKMEMVFNLDLNDIKSISQGKQGFNKNVLEITDKNNNTYRVVVKNFDEWAELVKSKS